MVNIFDDKDYMLWRLFCQARNAIMKARQRELGTYNLSARQAGALLISDTTDGNVTPYQMARWKILERHSISELLARMEKQGLIRKVSNLDNRKSVRVELTEKGSKAAQQAARCEAFHKIMSCLSTEQRQQFEATLKMLRDVALAEIGIKGKLPYPPF